MNVTDQNAVDIVLPWVDGSDPKWLKKREHYAELELKNGVTEEQKRTANAEERFRDWGLLRYLFRGIEKNLPWIRKVHFVTEGHLPEWLDGSCPKLNIVKHEDFIPAEYLPTFSSHAIELNFHRISGLSENFIYFNDDFFALRAIPENAYFKNGLPRDYAIQNARAVEMDDFFFIPMIDDAVVNRLFTKSETVKKHRGKWFSPCYGIYNLLNLAFMKWSNFTGFVDAHLPTPYTKRDFERAWELAGERLERACRHRFRRNDDVNVWVIRYIRLCEGRFLPKACEPLDAMFSFELGEEEILKRCLKTIRTGSRPVICINDGSRARSFQRDAKKIQEALEERFPKRSSFERKQ